MMLTNWYRYVARGVTPSNSHYSQLPPRWDSRAKIMNVRQEQTLSCLLANTLSLFDPNIITVKNFAMITRSEYKKKPNELWSK